MRKFTKVHISACPNCHENEWWLATDRGERADDWPDFPFALVRRFADVLMAGSWYGSRWIANRRVADLYKRMASGNLSESAATCTTCGHELELSPAANG